MRARLIFIVIAIVLVGGFAAQNWGEFNQASPLTFGVVQSEAPLGLILLGVLGITLLVFLFSSAMQESRSRANRYCRIHRRARRAMMVSSSSASPGSRAPSPCPRATSGSRTRHMRAPPPRSILPTVRSSGIAPHVITSEARRAWKSRAR